MVSGFGGFVLPEVLFYQLDKRNRMSKGQSEKEAAAGALESGTLGAYENTAYMEGLKKTAESMGIDSNSFDSASLKPRRVIAGEPIRKPEVTNGERGSFGTEFLLTVIFALPRAASASLPVISLSIKSSKNKWLSVLPDTTL